MVNSHGRFVWYELATTDTETAKAFYAGVVGWGTRDSAEFSIRVLIAGLPGTPRRWADETAA